jgi:hypothetical protein
MVFFKYEHQQEPQALGSKELATWSAELPTLRSRIAEALAKSSVPGRLKIEL